MKLKLKKNITDKKPHSSIKKIFSPKTNMMKAMNLEFLKNHIEAVKDSQTIKVFQFTKISLKMMKKRAMSNKIKITIILNKIKRRDKKNSFSQMMKVKLD